MRVLVTGGAGFIGRWVCDGLLAQGHDVIALDDLSNGREGNIKEFTAKRSFAFVRGDIADPKAVASAVRDPLDMCIHLAAIIEVQRSIEDPWRTFDVNVTGTANLLEACRRRDAKLVQVSTCMVYDMASERRAISEDHPVKPMSPYASTKAAADLLALSYHGAYGLPVTVLRPFNTYGPFQKSNQEGGVVAVFLRCALEGKPLQVFGDGTQTRDLMYVGDCVEFILRAAFEKRAEGEVFNAGTGREIAVNDLAKLIAGPKGRIEHVPHPHPQSEIRRMRCDSSKSARILGWGAKVPLEEGIRRTREWMAG